MKKNFQIKLPQHTDDAANAKEYFFLIQEGQERKILLHDYSTM